MGSVAFVGFVQALGLVAYITLIATVLQSVFKSFGPINEFYAPILMLSLLSFSVLICGLISLGYPIKLFFVKKEPQKALKIVGFTAGFLFLFITLIAIFVFVLN